MSKNKFEKRAISRNDLILIRSLSDNPNPWFNPWSSNRHIIIANEKDLDIFPIREIKRTYPDDPKEVYHHHVISGNTRSDVCPTRESKLLLRQPLRLRPEEVNFNRLENQRTTLLAMPLERETEWPFYHRKQPTTKKTNVLKKIGQKLFTRKETDGKPENLKAGRGF